MSYRRVRIYDGVRENTNIIGFSLSATEAPDDEKYSRFMAERDYASWDSALTPSYGVSYRYVEVEPPLSKQHTQEFGKLCVGGMIDGQYVDGIVDAYHDGILVYDNRDVIPLGPFAGGELIARG